MIPQILTFGKLLTSLATLAGKGGENVEKANELLTRFGTAYNVMNTTSASQSAGRVLISPMVAIERDLVHQDYANDLMVTILIRDIKDALLHLALQGTVAGIKISQLADSINPRRRGGFMALSGLEAFGVAGLEAATPTPKDKKGVPEENSVIIAGKEYADLQVAGNLAMGRTVTAQVQINEVLVNLPLNFREVPVPISSKNLELIFQAARPKDGMFARIAMKESGEIDSPEFFTGIDEIKREFNIRLNDLSGYYEEAHDRQATNRVAALTTGIMSMNTMANTIIMSSDTARQIELEQGIRFDKRGIEKIRKSVLANSIVIVNEGEGMVTFWTAGQNLPEEYTFRQLKGIAQKDTSLDLPSLMKLFGGR